MSRTGWLLNLRISGSICMDREAKAVSWNVGPVEYKGRKKEMLQLFEQEPPMICLQDVKIPKRRKNSIKRELQRVLPHYWI